MVKCVYVPTKRSPLSQSPYDPRGIDPRAPIDLPRGQNSNSHPNKKLGTRKNTVGKELAKFTTSGFVFFSLHAWIYNICFTLYSPCVSRTVIINIRALHIISYAYVLFIDGDEEINARIHLFFCLTRVRAFEWKKQLIFTNCG